MKRTAKNFAAAVLAGSVALGMGAAPAAADGDRDGYSSRHHDGDRERHGDYEKDYDDDRYDGPDDSEYDGHDDSEYDDDRYDHDGYREGHDDGDRDDDEYRSKGDHRHEDGYDGEHKHHWGDRDHWDGEESEKRDIDWYRDRIAGAQAERKALKIKAERAKVAHRDGTVKKREFTEADAVAMHQRALVFKLSRAEAFLAGLADRLSDSGMDASVKEPLLEAVATYQARVAQLQVAAENATTKEDLKAIYGQLRELGWEFVSQMVEMRKATVTPKHS